MPEINGLKLYVEGKELIELTAKRAEYHKTRSKHYAKKAAELLRTKAGAIEERAVDHDEDDDDENRYKFSASNAVTETASFERKAKNHLEKAEYFEFVSKHIKPAMEYVLEDHDLRTLEIVKG